MTTSPTALLPTLTAALPCAPLSVTLMSCQNITGFSDLLSHLEQAAKDRFEKHSSEDPLITRERHRLHLQQCVTALKQFEVNFRTVGLVLAAEELRHAILCLGRITGRVAVEDLLDVIFRDFCVGK
jgi:tRNA modification GTPase